MIRHYIDPRLKIKKLEELIDLPSFVIVNKFDEAASKDFRNHFSQAINSGQKIIPILIDSYGGHIYSLMSMIATIKASPVPVATIANGKAMSCGAILLSFGAEGLRFMDPFATLLIHDVSSASMGKVEEIKADAKELERLNQVIYKMMAQNVGKPDDYFLKLVHENAHADLFLSADEAKKHNIVNHLRLPDFKVKISTEILFE